MLEDANLMRGLIIALALLIPTTAHAQRIHGASQPPPTTQTIHPPPATPPAGWLAPTIPFDVSDPTRPPRDLYRVQGRDPLRSPRSTLFFDGSYPGVYAMDLAPELPAPPPSPPPAPVRVATGLLRLSVTPADARIFIDSYFVGIASEVEARRTLTLEAGPHRIEIRAPQHETRTFDVRIPANDTVTYRASLEPLRPVAPPPVGWPAPTPATSSAPMYLIPKCYLGNVPPRPSRLPSDCDITQVQVLGRR